MRQLRGATQIYCKMFIDFNLNCIEAHLTDGINIDRLNNCEDIGQSEPG